MARVRKKRGQVGPRPAPRRPRPKARPRKAPAPKAPSRATALTRRPRRPRPRHSTVPFLFSVNDSRPVPASRPVGKATPLASQFLYNFPVPVDGWRRMFVVTNNGHSSSVAIQMQTNGVATGNNLYNVPIYSATPASGGPTSGRAMKAGLTISNATADIRCGGRIFVLNCDQRVSVPTLPSTMSAAQMVSLFDTVMNHPATVAYTGKHFQRRAVSFSTHAVDTFEYETFRPWIGIDTVDSFANHVFLNNGLGILDDGIRPMSTLFVLFEQPADAQDYTILLRHAVYTRWTLGTLGAISSRDVPVVSSETINKVLASR